MQKRTQSKYQLHNALQRVNIKLTDFLLMKKSKLSSKIQVCMHGRVKAPVQDILTENQVESIVAY